MAGKRIVTQPELKTAAGILAEKQGLTLSQGEGGSLTLMPGDILIKLEDGRPNASTPEIQGAIMEILMDMAEEPVKGSNLVVRSGGMAKTGAPVKNAAEAIQAMQSGKELMYQFAGNQPAPNATMALMAASDARINLEEISAVLTDELASSTVRATDRKGRYVDATIGVRKSDFINLLAWKEVEAQEKLKNPILDDADPLNIALPNGFPRIRPDATVSIRIKTKESNLIEKRRAIVHIYINAMQQWMFQQRQCQTKAKRNAIIQMLTSTANPMEVMDEDELADEQREVDMVAGAQ
jgi:hypothetical protein